MLVARPRLHAIAELAWPLTRAGARDAGDAADPWSAYWETLPFHADLCRLEAEDFVARLKSVVPLRREWHVLDFGCGFGVVAALLARDVAEVCAWDASPSMRRWAQRNAAGGAVRVIDSPTDPRLCGGGDAYDLIIVNSVIQYMQARERRDWLRRWRMLLAPDGRILLSDLVSPRHRVWDDVTSLLRFYGRCGRLVYAVRERVGDVVRYCRARRVRRLNALGREEL